MEGGKEALEKLAREVVALYGQDAPKMLLDRAALADEYGDNVQANAWRERSRPSQRGSAEARNSPL